MRGGDGGDGSGCLMCSCRTASQPAVPWSRAILGLRPSGGKGTGAATDTGGGSSADGNSRPPLSKNAIASAFDQSDIFSRSMSISSAMASACISLRSARLSGICLCQPSIGTSEQLTVRAHQPRAPHPAENVSANLSIMGNYTVYMAYFKTVSVSGPRLSTIMY